MNQQDVKRLARYLAQAEADVREVPGIIKEFPDLTMDDGYVIQKELLALKLSQGHKHIGYKMGLTSKAKMIQMKQDKPSYGFLCDYMMITDGGRLKTAELIHPRAEPEIAFIIDKEIKGKIGRDDVLKAIAYVAAATEILDSRYINFQFTMPDVIADNGSSARVVVGRNLKRLGEANLASLGIGIWINGELMGSGTGMDVLEDPLNSIVMLSELMSAQGQSIAANSLILSGAVTQAFHIKKGDVVITRVEDLSDATFTCV